MAPKPQRAQLAPLALERDVCAGFDPDDEGDAQLAEQGKQGHISKTPIRRDDDAVLPNGLGHTAHRTTDDRQFVAFHAPFSHRGVIGAPVNRYRATADNEGDHEQMLMRFNGPVNRQSHVTVLRELMQGL